MHWIFSDRRDNILWYFLSFQNINKINTTFSIQIYLIQKSKIGLTQVSKF